MSMRICSFDSSVQDEHSKKTAPNSTHCSSSHEFEETSNNFLITALMVEIMTASRINQLNERPTAVETRSINRLRLSNKSMFDPPGHVD